MPGRATLALLAAVCVGVAVGDGASLELREMLQGVLVILRWHQARFCSGSACQEQHVESAATREDGRRARMLRAHLLLFCRSSIRSQQP